MLELLERLPPGARVLDLGAQSGSFDSPRTDIAVIRLDLEIPRNRRSGAYVCGDAARMPWTSGSFDLIISNHSLEHFVALEETVREIQRVLKPGAGLYVAVPDATTLTDKIYRWLGRGGGHVNAFRSPHDVIRRFDLPCRGVRPLYSGLSFLNRKNIEGRPQKKMLLFANGNETFLAYFVSALRVWDSWFGTRLSHYGWCFYFGNLEAPQSEPWKNVCIRCGSAHPVEKLPKVRWYECPQCGAKNRKWATDEHR